MSANDILDVLNISRDDSKQPAKKKQKINAEPAPRQTGMARELYNLLGPNTPPVNITNLSTVSRKDNVKFKVSPWTKMPFNPNKTKKDGHEVILNHWVKGSKELLEQDEKDKPYFFDKFDVKLDIPELVDEDTFDTYMEEIREHQKKIKEERKQREKEKKEQEAKDRERREKEKQKLQEQKNSNNSTNSSDNKSNQETDNAEEKKKESNGELSSSSNTSKNEEITGNASPSKVKVSEVEANEEKETTDAEKDEEKPAEEEEEDEEEDEEYLKEPWTYEETQYLFDLCSGLELKWPIIYDRYNYGTDRSAEDLREQFYSICLKILDSQETKNPALIDSLRAYSKYRELDRKQYLENLLKRTPAEIAEEESLVIEARRFEMAAKKMLLERSHLLSLLDSPQSTQQVQQYLSSQGITNLYNHLMILDKNQKKRQAQQSKSQVSNQEPVPPPIPIAASSSFKKDKSFQTHLQQYLAGVLKQNQNANPGVKQEANAIQQLLMKRLTQKEEEAYGLFFHGTEKLTPGVTLRSTQKLPGLQQKQSVLKSVNQVFQELDIPTAGGTSWKPVMPTRKSMAAYDDLLKSVVALLELKKGKDKLESEIKLIKSQRGLQ
ncbi:hypothetical protein DFJ63DRAFT_315551 [Scheffersomyces coipomensis]|uniref:uncharacterized protein n=1 Tax=Scheffersomyces coipomensis TaxID=1788519 RepID=UPI00315D9D5A